VVLVNREWSSHSPAADEFRKLETTLTSLYGNPGASCLDESWDPSKSWRRPGQQVTLAISRTSRRLHLGFLEGTSPCSAVRAESP
jgi:hypothetical protein